MYTQTSAHMSKHTLPQTSSHPDIPPTPQNTHPHTPGRDDMQTGQTHTHRPLTCIPDIPDSFTPFTFQLLYTLEALKLQILKTSNSKHPQYTTVYPPTLTYYPLSQIPAHTTPRYTMCSPNTVSQTSPPIRIPLRTNMLQLHITSACLCCDIRIPQHGPLLMPSPSTFRPS